MYNKEAIEKYREKNKENYLDYQKEYYEKTKEDRAKYKKEWYQRRKEELKKDRESQVHISANINKDDYEKMKIKLAAEGKNVTDLIREAVEEKKKKQE